jgi:hypothetical protein
MTYSQGISAALLCLMMSQPHAGKPLLPAEVSAASAVTLHLSTEQGERLQVPLSPTGELSRGVSVFLPTWGNISPIFGTSITLTLLGQSQPSTVIHGDFEDVSDTRATSHFSVGELIVGLTQYIKQGAHQKLVLVQTYRLHNAGATELRVRVGRYLDADVVNVEQNISYLPAQSRRAFIFARASTGEQDAVPYVGQVSLKRGQHPRHAVRRCCNRTWLTATEANTVYTDTNGDGLGDLGADVAMMDQRSFVLAPKARAEYVVKTLFGIGTPSSVVQEDSEP